MKKMIWNKKLGFEFSDEDDDGGEIKLKKLTGFTLLTLRNLMGFECLG